MHLDYIFNPEQLFTEIDMDRFYIGTSEYFLGI